MNSVSDKAFSEIHLGLITNNVQTFLTQAYSAILVYSKLCEFANSEVSKFRLRPSSRGLLAATHIAKGWNIPIILL